MVFGGKNRKAERGESELLHGLVRLASEIQSGSDLEGIVRAIVSTVTSTFGYRESTVYLVEPDGAKYRAWATVGEHPDYDADVFARPVPSHIWDELLVERHQIGSSFFIDHRRHEWTEEQLYYLPPLPLGPRRPGEWDQDDDLFVPFYDKRHQLMGVVDLYDPEDKAIPTLEQVKALEVFAAHAAVAVESARQQEQLEATGTELERELATRHQLLNLSTALLSTLDQRDVFQLITTMLKQIVDYDTMDIRLVDEDTNELVAIYARDESAEQMLDFRSALDEGVTGWVVSHNEAQLVNDMNTDPRGVFIPGTEEGEPQASIIVPLNVRGKVTGVLSIDRLGGGTFAEEELEPAKLFANMAAIAIQNARSYEDMERQAISDGLTGIHNYRHFHDTLKATVSRAERYEETFCLLMMDLDHFKTVNDTIGHQAGDEVLRDVADVLRSCSRESDYQARYGGEEFVMILPQTGLAEAATLAERVREQVAQIDADAVRVTMSIGVAAFPESARRQRRRAGGGRRRPAARQGAWSQPGLSRRRRHRQDGGDDRRRPGRRGPPFRRAARAQRVRDGRPGHGSRRLRGRRVPGRRRAGDPRRRQRHQRQRPQRRRQVRRPAAGRRGAAVRQRELGRQRLPGGTARGPHPARRPRLRRLPRVRTRRPRGAGAAAGRVGARPRSAYGPAVRGDAARRLGQRTHARRLTPSA